MVYAKYTIVLKTLLDNPQTKALIDKALSSYPLYAPLNDAKFTEIPPREEINKKLLDHFKYREIGFETIGRFVDELEIAMNEIMPYYNQLFASEDIINSLEDIFANVDFVEQYNESGSNQNEDDTTKANSIDRAGTGKTTAKDTSTGESETNTTGTDSSNSDVSMQDNSKTIESATPQNNVLNITGENIDSVPYADKVSWNKHNSTSSTETEGTTSTNSKNTNSNESNSNIDVENNESIEENGTIKNVGSASHSKETTFTKKGNQGVNTYAHDMLEFRTLFLNIVQQIINDERIQELFMQVY